MNEPVGRSAFTVEEIAERNHVSVPTVYRAIRSGKLQAITLGTGTRRAVRITLEQERAWHHACTRSADVASLNHE
jgi:excisionase family DNA binding protein